MFRLIATIQQKPLHERRRFAFWAAFSVTALIALVWVVTLLMTGSGAAAETAAAKTPFSAFFDSISEGFSVLRDALPNGD